MPLTPKRVGFVVFPGIQALDLAGPMDAFAEAQLKVPPQPNRPCYELVTIGLTGRAAVASSGLRILPQFTFESAPPLDTLIVPGGAGARDPKTCYSIGAWVKSQSNQIRRIAAVCTGVYGLAASGLLDGRRATTHWEFVKDIATRYPSLNVDPDALFVKDGRFYTSAGITAGIDLSLALIEEDYGIEIALTVARGLVVYLKRSGGQAQYSEPLRFQTQSSDRLARVASWAAVNLNKSLSVEELARRARLSPRQFTRQFGKRFGATPAAFVETARLNEAKERLTKTHARISRVASSVGFRSADVFRRRFERQFGVTPTAYRDRFNGSATSSMAPRANHGLGK
jgi:transcriptional regulator GlxA family with amidase domain